MRARAKNAAPAIAPMARFVCFCFVCCWCYVSLLNILLRTASSHHQHNLLRMPAIDCRRRRQQRCIALVCRCRSFDRRFRSFDVVEHQKFNIINSFTLPRFNHFFFFEKRNLFCFVTMNTMRTRFSKRMKDGNKRDSR
jgi:hypothetical protein